MRAKQEKVTIAFTAAGTGWLIVSFIAFLLATNYNNNVVFMLACLLLGIWLLAAGLTLKNLAGLKCMQWQVAPSFVGDDAVLQLLVEADKGRQHLELNCRMAGLSNKDQSKEDQGRMIKVDGYERQWLTLALTMEKRGWFVPEAVSVFSMWPFGLWRASMAAPEIPAFLVFPKPTGSQSLPEVHNVNTDEQSLDDLSGVRVYQAGDNIRRMDWKSMARTDQVLVKTFEGREHQQTLWLSDESVNVTAFEEKIEQLARWIIECNAIGINYGIKVGSEKLLPGSGQDHQIKGLRLLALVGHER